MRIRQAGAVLAVVVALLANVAIGGDTKGRKEAQRLVKDGDAQLLLGDVDAAKKAYQDALTADATYAPATIRLAFAEHRSGNDEQAEQLLEALIATGNAPADAYHILGVVEVARREWKKATAAYEAYLKLEPSDYRARLALARVWRQLAGDGGDSASSAKKSAIAEYERVMLDARADNAIQNEAEEELLAVKYGAIGAAYQEGRQAYVNGDYRGAVKKLETITREHPEIEEAQFMLGMAYVTPEINRRADAMKVWDKAPKVKEAQLHLGIEFHDDGDLKNAETRLDKAIALDERYQEAWYHLGTVFAEQGDYDKATQAWERTMDIDPESEAGKWAATKHAMATARGTDGGTFQEGQVFDPASETQMGHKFEKMALEYFGGEIDDPKLQARFEKIFAKLVATTDRGELPYKVYLVQTDMINAFSAPGGRIFVTKGLIDAIKTRMGDKDEMYAAILGHEIAHSTLRHMPERWKYVQSVINDPKASQRDIQGMFIQMMTGMTRGQEYEADQYGALYMYRAGYNPRWAIELHHQFGKVIGEIPEGMDHPPFADRAARLKDFLIELRGRVREFERGNEAFKKGDWAEAGQHYEIFLAVLPHSAPGHMNLALTRHRQALVRLGTDQKYKRSTDLDPDSKAAGVALHSAGGGEKADARIDQGLMREAAAEYKTALRLDPTYALARINYGALLLDLAQVPAAIKVLERATKLDAKNAAAWNNLGIAYAMNKKAAKKAAGAAQKALNQAVALDAKLADPLYNLGVVLADAGDGEKAMAAYEAYAKLDPSSGWAKQARARKAELAEKAAAKKPAKPSK